MLALRRGSELVSSSSRITLALPPGRYFVAVLLDEHAAYDAAVFYLGVESLKNAKVFTLGDGESLSEIDFKIGRPKFRVRYSFWPRPFPPAFAQKNHCASVGANHDHPSSQGQI
jgi:hypothetical protein